LYTTEVIVAKSCREAGLFSSETWAARIEHGSANTRASSGFRPLLQQKFEWFNKIEWFQRPSTPWASVTAYLALFILWSFYGALELIEKLRWETSNCIFFYEKGMGVKHDTKEKQLCAPTKRRQSIGLR
jgi:hypothetical protein